MTPLEVGLVAFVIGTALLAATLRDLVGAIVAFGAFSLGLALIWILLAAPDVALAEAAVGAGVLSVLLVITVARTTTGPPEAITGTAEDDGGDEPAKHLRSTNLPLLGAILFLAVPLFLVVRELSDVGAPAAPAVRFTFSDGTRTPYGYYVEHTLAETGFSNAVAAVLVVYRTLDTLGELIVAFAAVAGVLLVLRGGELR